MNFVKKYGLSTYHGTNVVAILLAVMEYVKTSFDPDTQKWLLPTLWAMLCLVFWLIRGNTAPAIADELNDIGHEDIASVLKEGRD